MIYTDRYIVSPADLNDFDNEVQDAADACGLDLALSCRNCVSDISTYLLNRLQNATNLIGGIGLSQGHLSAVYNSGVSGMSPRVRLEQIVIDSWEGRGITPPIKLWAIYFALFHIYRELSNRKVIDKYADKAERFAEEKHNRWVWLQMNGLPVVLVPFPAPAADLWPNPGTFDSSNISLVPTNGALGGSFDIAVAYADTATYNAAFVNRGNSESSPSPTVSMQVPSGYAMSVHIESLVPPDGTPMTGGPLDSFVPTVRATAWQVLAGPTGGPLTVQNANPIPLSTTSFALPSDPTANPRMPASQGQYPLRKLQIVDAAMFW